MVMQRTYGANDSLKLMGVLASQRGFSGALGLDWPLAIQIVGWVIQGIGLGLSVVESVRAAGQQMKPGETVDQTDISAMAQQLALQYPSMTAAEWEASLRQGLAAKVQLPTLPGAGLTCPPGFVRDANTGACLEIKEAGMGIPTWGWFGIGALGLYLLFQSGVLAKAR